MKITDFFGVEKYTVYCMMIDTDTFHVAFALVAWALALKNRRPRIEWLKRHCAPQFSKAVKKSFMTIFPALACILYYSMQGVVIICQYPGFCNFHTCPIFDKNSCKIQANTEWSKSSSKITKSKFDFINWRQLENNALTTVFEKSPKKSKMRLF